MLGTNKVAVVIVVYPHYNSVLNGHYFCPSKCHSQDTNSCYHFFLEALVLDFPIKQKNYIGKFLFSDYFIYLYNLKYFMTMPRCCRGKSDADQG